MSPGVQRLFLMLAIGALSGCVGGPAPVVSYRAPQPSRGIVFVVDGAGGYQIATRAVSAAVERSGTPLAVRSFDWTHGRGQGIADVTDVPHSRAQSFRLAGEVLNARAAHPNQPVYLIAHSAGSAVALGAADWLPPDSLETIILLAPAVSADYDLCRALSASRGGIDAFTSELDRFYLGLGTNLVGTADGKRGSPVAGRVGFEPAATCRCAALATRLRQHPWNVSSSWSGNHGDHSGALQPEFLRAYVLPLLAVQ